MPITILSYMRSRNFTLSEQDIEKIDQIAKAHGIPSRSETIRRLVEMEVVRLGGGGEADES